MIFKTYGGTVTHEDIQKEHEQERQEIINKYQKEGYFLPWYEAKADYEIKYRNEQKKKELVPLNELKPLD